jgi:alpha,alpha-trehalase
MRDDDIFAPGTLRDYALVADGERGALIGPRGDIAFLCAPRWHDPAVFSSLVGGVGRYSVTPSCPRFVWGGHYEPRSLIWRSRWVTTEGIIECREALAYPGDRHRLVLLRRIMAVEGRAQLDIALDPRPNFGRGIAPLKQEADGRWVAEADGLHLRWHGAPESCRLDGTVARCRIELREGAQHDLVLEISDRPLPRPETQPDQAWTATEAAWHQAVPAMRESLAPGDVDHSYAVLRGLTSQADGMVAAATMALPERAEAGRNYDYRYAWIRDQCYTGRAAALVAADDLLDSATRFVCARLLTDGPRLRPAYTVDGGRVPDEVSLDLPGYPGGAVKVGNWVNEQFQLDSLGEILLLLATAVRRGHETPDQHRAALLAERVIEERWREPDAGIWELDNRQWTHSKLMCAAGLRSYAEARPGRDTATWTGLGDHIVAVTDTTSRHPSGRWQRADDDGRVDASLLLPALRGAVDPKDRRSTATVDAVRRELGRDGYVYRFRHATGPLNDAEGAFVLCGFQMALATHQQGNQVEAVRWFERNRGALGPPGLFTEEFDVVQRQLRGNLPQAFVHALLIEAAVTLHQPPVPTSNDGPLTEPVPSAQESVYE